MTEAAQSRDVLRYRISSSRRVPEGRALASDTDKPRVLVVDDDFDSAWSLATILELDGHHVRMAFDGESALATATLFQPRLTILDIAMPRMDGYEVCRRLRATPEGRRMVIAALTGLGQKNDRLRSRRAGFDIHMLKPIEPYELGRLTRSLLPRPQ